MKWGLKGGISIDANSGPLRYVFWCYGSIFHQLLTFIQIYSENTVRSEWIIEWMFKLPFPIIMTTIINGKCWMNQTQLRIFCHLKRLTKKTMTDLNYRISLRWLAASYVEIFGTLFLDHFQYVLWAKYNAYQVLWHIPEVSDCHFYWSTSNYRN